MKRIMIVALVATAFAAVGSSAQAAERSAARGQVIGKGELVAQVKVAASEFKFVLSAKSARRGVVIFKVTNAGAVQHDFEIKGRKTRLLSHGQSATLRVTFLRKGTYPYTCTVPGHAAAGMKALSPLPRPGLNWFLDCTVPTNRASRFEKLLVQVGSVARGLTCRPAVLGTVRSPRARDI